MQYSSLQQVRNFAAVKSSAEPHANSTTERPTSDAFAPRASRTAKARSGPNTVAGEPGPVLPKPFVAMARHLARPVYACCALLRARRSWRSGLGSVLLHLERTGVAS